MTPEAEAARLEKLKLYALLDTPPERAFDELTELAAVLLDVPIALISLMDERRQWFKAKVGIQASEIDRSISLCSQTMEQTGILEVPDALADERFATHPMVINAPHLRFYAGVPLVVGGGERLGSLCVIDRKPRTLTEKQRTLLTNLGHQVVAQFELRRLIAVQEQAALANRQAMMRADRLAMVGQLAAGVAHELGTPLAVISGRSKMMIASSVPQDQWPSHAKIISEQSDRMTGIIQQMLYLARRREPKKITVDLRSVARQTTVMLLTEARNRSVQLTYEPDALERPGQLDPSQLVQVVTNLTMNALQASPHGKHVTVSTGAETRSPPAEIGGGARACIFVRVQDEGSGIAPENLQRVFEPFFTTKKSREGTGLGLAVAWSITRDHDGWIEVESDPQRGSRFTVYVPQTPASH